MTEHLEHLHRRLVADAARDGLLDVAYRVVDSPIGDLLLASTEAGVVRVAFTVQDHDAVLAQLAATVSPRVLRAPNRLDPVVRQLDEYFAGTRTSFDLSLDLRTRGFRRDVLAQLEAIPYGATRSYAAVASGTASPRAVRAVGTACATNPLPLLIPCHRVVRSDGSMGRYAGGESAKRQLLDLEADG